MPDDSNDHPLHPSLFEGRLLIDILSWDWQPSVGLSRIGPRKYRFQGGLDLARSVTIEGRIQAPQEHRGREVEVSLYPIHRGMRFGRFARRSVGSIRLFRPADDPEPCNATLLFPDTDMPMLAVTLSKNLRYLHLWTNRRVGEALQVRYYGFSSTIGEKVKPWAGVD